MIRLVLHLEPTSEGGRLVWWAESPDLPGFSATEDDLQSLIVRSSIAIQDAYPELMPAEFSYEMSVDMEPATADVLLTFEGGANPDTANPSPKSATARLVPSSA